MPRGGYQQPSRPAPVSGPGAMSRRTDGQPKQRLANAAYGEQADFQSIQDGARMSASPDAGMASMGQMPNVVPLNAPTQRPDEPITAGAPMGPGPGPEAIGLGKPSQQSVQDAVGLGVYLPSLEQAASVPNAPQSFVRFVKYIRSQANAAL